MPRKRQLRSRYAVLAELADMLQSVFIAEVQSRQARRGEAISYRPSPKTDWLALASFVLTNGLPLREWTQFVVRKSTIVKPSQLKSESLLQEYQETEERRLLQGRQWIQMRFTADKSTVAAELGLIVAGQAEPHVEQRLSRADMIANVLANDLLSISSLFRYCWAREQEMERLADAYYANAVWEYSAQPDTYDEVWGELIPRDFRAEARAVFNIGAQHGG